MRILQGINAVRRFVKPCAEMVIALKQPIRAVGGKRGDKGGGLQSDARGQQAPRAHYRIHPGRARARHAEHGHAHDEPHIPSDLYFIKTALILAFVTALETSTYWWPESMHGLATPSLLIMMTIKFFMILLVFMHLKFDNKLFSLMFYIGLVLAVGVYLVALLTFQFFAR